ncbi:MAG TPA: K(+)-transporting ATPase subunit F [Steroidobacteraceae bacterium]|nr:K(+)-transporting ATPase subunit F [Steroidobacteraceae bacterium]
MRIVDVISLVLATGLVVYLVIALLKPEKFQ